MKDFEEEKSMYSQTEQLITFLFEWKCLYAKFFHCVLDLSSQMAEKNFWELTEVNGIKNWLEDLKRLGYKEPVISNFNKENSCGSENFKNISKVILKLLLI